MRSRSRVDSRRRGTDDVPRVVEIARFVLAQAYLDRLSLDRRHNRRRHHHDMRARFEQARYLRRGNGPASDHEHTTTNEIEKRRK